MLPSILSSAAVLVLSLFLVLKITITAEKLQLQINIGQKYMQNCKIEMWKVKFSMTKNVIAWQVFRQGAVFGRTDFFFLFPSIIFSLYEWFQRNPSFQNKVMLAVNICSWCEQAKFSSPTHH